MTDQSDKARIPDPCDEKPMPFPCPDLGRPGPITEHEVKCAQQAWCLGLLEISESYQADPEGDYRETTDRFLRDLYDFSPSGKVFFRPTLAEFPNNFRTTFEGTREYFIGVDNAPGDGFAKKNFKSIKFSNILNAKTCGIQIHEKTAMAMGNVFFEEETPDGIKETIVDKVFVYLKDHTTNHHLKLIVHMSALRNEPGKPALE